MSKLYVEPEVTVSFGRSPMKEYRNKLVLARLFWYNNNSGYVLKNGDWVYEYQK